MAFWWEIDWLGGEGGLVGGGVLGRDGGMGGWGKGGWKGVGGKG